MVHDLSPESKILSAFAFVLVVVATPIERFWAYLGFLVLVMALIRLAQLPYRTVFIRSLVEIPFILFALLMPFFGTGNQVEIVGLQLYETGLLAGASIIAKGTLGVLTAVILSATTSARDFLRGLESLRIPAPLVNIASFMFRYLNVINDELGRMRIARESRGFDERGIRSWRILAQTVGALFIRSYERGERVYLAMLSRGYTGSMPNLSDNTQSRWLRALLLPLLAALISIGTGVFA